MNNLDQGLFRLDSGLIMCPGLNGKSIKLRSQKCRTSFLERVTQVVDEEPDPAHPAQIAVQENPGRTPLVELGAGNALELGEDRRDPGRKEGHPRAGMDQVQMHFRVGHRVADARLWEGGFCDHGGKLGHVPVPAGRSSIPSLAHDREVLVGQFPRATDAIADLVCRIAPERNDAVSVITSFSMPDTFSDCRPCLAGYGLWAGEEPIAFVMRKRSLVKTDKRSFLERTGTKG